MTLLLAIVVAVLVVFFLLTWAWIELSENPPAAPPPLQADAMREWGVTSAEAHLAVGRSLTMNFSQVTTDPMLDVGKAVEASLREHAEGPRTIPLSGPPPIDIGGEQR